MCPESKVHLQLSAQEANVTVSGELDRRMVGSLLHVADRIRSNPGCVVDVDLSGVSQMDASGLPGIVALMEAALEDGDPFNVIAADAATAALLTGAGISPVQLAGG